MMTDRHFKWGRKRDDESFVGARHTAAPETQEWILSFYQVLFFIQLF